VVEIGGAALWFIINTTLVELEGWLRGIDGNADGLLSNSDLKSAFISSREILVSSDGGSLVAWVVAARKWTLGLIRIARLSIDSLVFDDILESAIHLTSLTSFIAVRAATVDQVLLGKLHELLGGHEVNSFHRSGGGERPARATLALVLDGSHRT